MKIKIFQIIFLIFLPLLFSCNQKKEKNKVITIGFGGDAMLGRLVNEQISQTDYKYPWGNMLSLLQKNNFNIVNLETTFTRSQKAIPKVFNFKSDPDNVEVLKIGNIEIVNLANNHILDFSAQGLSETIKVLDENNILHAGAGEDIELARKPAVIEKEGIKIGVLGYTDNEPDWLATQNKPGTNFIEVGDIEKIKKDVNELKNEVDVVVVSIHWGPNKIIRPTQEFVNFAHKIIDCGVDIIHGHSAHFFQGIEIYKGKVIMYSAGDFVDDYAVYEDLRNDWTFLFNIKIDKNGPKEIELIPLLISNMQVNRIPENEINKIFDIMKPLCAEFKTKIEMSYDKGYIKIK
ncbi:MAG: CapA family protein [bacterium]